MVARRFLRMTLDRKKKEKHTAALAVTGCYHGPSGTQQGKLNIINCTHAPSKAVARYCKNTQH